MKALVYAQHLSGVGHRVRAEELSRALAREHRVALVDGGRPVPRRAPVETLSRIAIPGLARGPRGLEPLEAGRSLAEVRAARRDALVAQTRELAPDLLVVEHYPFSKWELRDEIDAALDAARASNPELCVVCSLRDVSPRTRHEGADAVRYAERVDAILRARFDAVVVHADERFTRLDEHFGGTLDPSVPVFHAGFVSEPVPEDHASTGGHAVLGVGGGAGSVDFALDGIAAWKRLGERRTLVVFGGLFWTPDETARVRAAAAGAPIRVEAFGPAWLDGLAGADVAITRAGYNTCTNLLATRRPAVLVPHPRMSDQAFRAERFAERGLAQCVDADSCDPGAIAEAVARALAAPPPRHDFALDGADRAARLLEALVAMGPDLRALARGAPEGAARWVGVTPTTTLPSRVRRRASFALDRADGARVKGRRFESAKPAERVRGLLGRIGRGVPCVRAHRGDALLLDWIEGESVAAVVSRDRALLRRSGEWLGSLHAEQGAEDDVAPTKTIERVDLDLEALTLAGTLERSLADGARKWCEAYAPRAASTGVIHRDFCAENLVLDRHGELVSIDNASLTLGPHDEDVARAWVRWPMTRTERREFVAGYEKHRPLEAFFAGFPFWACAELTRSAANRVDMRVAGAEPLVERLGRLVSVLDGGARPDSAFWDL